MSLKHMGESYANRREGMNSFVKNVLKECDLKNEARRYKPSWSNTCPLKRIGVVE